MKWYLCIITGLIIGAAMPATVIAENYNIGVGISDITGEAAEVDMMGYAQLTQIDHGIHLRLHARAFAIEDIATSNNVLIVVTETALMTQAVHQAVLARLKTLYGELYNAQNVLLTATHTHSGPGGYSHYALYNFTQLGFQARTFDAMVEGIMDAIKQAVANKAPGKIYLNQGELTSVSKNRSPMAFRNNPQMDKNVFPLEIDPLMTVLRFRQSEQEQDIGMLSLFPTHGTSMTASNKLISSDNKGYAAWHWEHNIMRADTGSPNRFVAAFAQTNPGDLTPNLDLLPGHGPTNDEFENTRITGMHQFDTAYTLWSDLNNAILLSDGLDSRMRYVDMSQVQVQSSYTGDGKIHTTCSAAMGVSMAAGAPADGPSSLYESGLVRPGENNPILNALGELLFNVPDDLSKCQAPKEVLLAVGKTKPYPWTPEILPVQLMRIGQLYLAALPVEPTIMSGYRIRRQLAETLNIPVNRVIVVGYSNAYSDYLTTPEEYDMQYYEGGSTAFGRWTLSAFTQEMDKLAYDMKNGINTISTLQPRNLSGKQLNFNPGVVFDHSGLFTNFGEEITDVNALYKQGDTVTAVFQTGHPKNNLRRNDTFLEVQKLQAGSFITVANDSDWNTTYTWTRTSTLLAQSTATITWAIPADTPPGIYRIVHYGDSKSLFGYINAFTGVSGSFQIVSQ